jgi:hypothetical protein
MVYRGEAKASPQQMRAAGFDLIKHCGYSLRHYSLSLLLIKNGMFILFNSGECGGYGGCGGVCEWHNILG